MGSDGGLYTCRATNLEDSTDADATVAVQGHTQVIPSNFELNCTQVISFRVWIKLYMNNYIYWYHPYHHIKLVLLYVYKINNSIVYSNRNQMNRLLI